MFGFVIVDINASDESMSAKSIVKVVTWKEFLSIVQNESLKYRIFYFISIDS